MSREMLPNHWRLQILLPILLSAFLVPLLPSCASSREEQQPDELSAKLAEVDRSKAEDEQAAIEKKAREEAEAAAERTEREKAKADEKARKEAEKAEREMLQKTAEAARKAAEFDFGLNAEE